MKQVFSPDGVRALRVPWALLALAVLASAAIAVGSHYFLASERRERASAGQRLQEARARLEAAQRERDSLRESAELFKALVDRGLMRAERRLELVEMVGALRARHQLFLLDYEIAPQRVLQLPGGRTFPSVDVLASRVRLRLQALHEGDVVDFIAALGHDGGGFHPVDRCVLRRIAANAAADSLAPRVEAECAFEWISLKDKNANRPG